MPKPPATNDNLELQVYTFGERISLLNFVVLRLFAGQYRWTEKTAYEQAVLTLMESYREQSRNAVKLECNRLQTQLPPGTENAEIHKMRLQQFEIIEKVATETAAYLLALHVYEGPPPTPQ